MSSITLTPNSFPPGNISVTPIFNGVAQPTKTCVVSLAPLTSVASINGNGTNCSSSTYTVAGYVPSQTITWSISNPAIASISSTTGATTTLTKISNGTVTLTASISNSCNQSTIVSRQIVIGAGEIPASNFVNGLSCVIFNQFATYTLTGDPVLGATSYKWSSSAQINDNGGPTCGWAITAGQGSQTCTYKVGCIETLAVVRVAAVNGCGESSYKYMYVNVKPTRAACNSARLANTIQKDGSYATVNINEDNNNEETLVANNTIDFAELYDLSGSLIKKYNTNNYNLNDVKKGIYILKVATNNQILTSKIIVQ